jgi:hypothetical protein
MMSGFITSFTFRVLLIAHFSRYGLLIDHAGGCTFRQRLR